MESGNYLHAKKKKVLYVKWMQVCASIKEGNSVLITIVLLVPCYLVSIFISLILSLGIGGKKTSKSPGQLGWPLFGEPRQPLPASGAFLWHQGDPHSPVGRAGPAWESCAGTTAAGMWVCETAQVFQSPHQIPQSLQDPLTRLICLCMVLFMNLCFKKWVNTAAHPCTNAN